MSSIPGSEHLRALQRENDDLRARLASVDGVHLCCDEFRKAVLFVLHQLDDGTVRINRAIHDLKLRVLDC